MELFRLKGESWEIVPNHSAFRKRNRSSILTEGVRRQSLGASATTIPAALVGRAIKMNLAGDKIGFVSEQGATRGASRYDAVIATLVGVCAHVSFRLHRLHAAPAGAGGGVADPGIR
jgi:hypothetical protein